MPMVAPTEEFSYEAIPIASTESAMTFPDTVRDFKAVNVQIENTGAAALTGLFLRSKCHPDAVAIDHAVTAPEWTVGSLIVDLNGAPFTLAANATCNLVINVVAQYQLIFTAICGTSTTLAVRGHLFSQGV